ncbi:MAG: NERD domain-containing protein [Coleofasciculus sp. G3-WIS-01]|uniref:UvrD-helicase domain-containing protein n=1 Tax=Coleofasciculus sp. G3-WIS-01 TaxID=3069528 RepID=UPI0032F77C3D
MAKLFPSEENISKLEKTEGEKCLLKFLKETLDKDDRFEIYYQPFLNGDKPDIIIMRKGSGVLIIEVKDWNLSSYYVDSQKQWRLKNNHSIIKSPIEQVKKYKDNLFNLHIEDLLERKIENQKFYAIVYCAVYFHNEDEQSIKDFFCNAFKYENAKKYIQVFGKDSLNIDKMKIILSKARLYENSSLFDEKLYNSFKRYLQPSFHTIEQGIEIKLTDKQKKLTLSKSSPRQKIKGIAGSGKTLILARRAVNAHKRTGDKVLILTYNITLKNYIHDRISEVREEFSWNSFYINNYHNFINAELNNVEIKIDVPENFETWSSSDQTQYWEENYYSNKNLFEGIKQKLRKYNAILIDELQDYKEEWQTIIMKFFLAEDGEYVVFGDVKQNIYKRNLDEYKNFKAIGMPGAWNVLNESFRLSTKVAHIAEKFQETFFQEKYKIDKVKIIKNNNNNKPEVFDYLDYMKNTSLNIVVDNIYNKINKYNIHPNDICFLSFTIQTVREIDYFIRNDKHEKTKVMFESKEIYDKIMSDKTKYTISKIEIKEIGENKKANFWINSGTVKLSTIHSFKGWEINTLVLIIEDYTEDSDDSMDELIYTGITRCRQNLIVVNLGNSKYHNFFNQVIDDDRNLTP